MAHGDVTMQYIRELARIKDQGEREGRIDEELVLLTTSGSRVSYPMGTHVQLHKAVNAMGELVEQGKLDMVVMVLQAMMGRRNDKTDILAQVIPMHLDPDVRKAYVIGVYAEGGDRHIDVYESNNGRLGAVIAKDVPSPIETLIRVLQAARRLNGDLGTFE